MRLVVPVPDLRHAADERPADRPEQPRDRRRRRPADQGQLSRAYTPALTTSAVEVQVLVAASRIAAVDPADPADPMETVDRRLRACGVHGGRPGAARRGRLVEPAPARRVGEDKRVLGVRPASWRVAELRGGAVAEPVAQWRRLARNTISRPGRTGAGGEWSGCEPSMWPVSWSMTTPSGWTSMLSGSSCRHRPTGDAGAAGRTSPRRCAPRGASPGCTAATAEHWSVSPERSPTGVSLAYLADVFITPGRHRGHGLGKLLVAVMIDRGAGAGFHWLLHTADAHSMYAGFGFAPANATLMERPGDRRTAPPSGLARPVAPTRRSFRRVRRALHTLGRGRFSAGAGRLACRSG